MRRIAPVLIATCFATAGFATPAQAQIEARLEIHGRRLTMSPRELERLTALGSVARGVNRAAQERALADAEAIANSPDARYLLAVYQLEIGQQRRDDALRVRGLDVLIASRETPPELLTGYLALRGDIAFRGGDHATASAAWTRLAELRAGDPQSLINLAQVRAAQGDAAGAVALIRRAIATPRPDGGAVPEAWHRQWLSLAYNGAMRDETVEAGLALIAAHPTPANRRLALVLYRQLASPQGAAEIELLRLMRAADTLARPEEYQRLAQLLLRVGEPGEARAVLDEGLSSGRLDRSETLTRDVSAEVDRNLARPRRDAAPSEPQSPAVEALRRAAALARSGRAAEAQSALRAVGEGGGSERWPAELARYWLAFLAQPTRAPESGVRR